MSRVAIVTGGGRGIGRSAALALSADGWSVVVTGRTAETLEATVADLEGDGLAVVADVADSDDVDRAFAATVDRFGSVDLLFNNAGMSARPVPIDELSVEDWKRVVDVNLTGSFLCARAAFAQMRSQNPQGGRIINNGSISATTPRPFSAPYTSTKHAVSGLTKSLALDGRACNIACGQIDIGNAATEMTAPMSSGIPQPNGETLVESTMDVDNVGNAIVYMAGLPLDANVLFMTVMASDMPFVGRG